MRRIILRTVLAVLVAGLFASAVITELYPSALMGWPVWVWYSATGVACVALSLTWIRSPPSKWPYLIKLRLQIWGLQLLKRFIQTRLFKYLVLRPFVLGFICWFVWKVFKAPEQIRVSDPKAREMLAQIGAQLEAKSPWPTDNAAREQGIALNRTMTWGVAGAALVLLTTVVVATHPSTDRAALIAAACFAFAIPTLIGCGFIQMSHASATPSEQGIQPPTLRQALKVLGRAHTAYFFVCVGMAAMLWSYSWIASVVFVLALYRAFRLYRRTVTIGTAKPGVTQVSGGTSSGTDKAA